jgi:thiol-disulfide isomerase/thioredoxin
MKKILLVTAIWCPSCLIMRPRYEQYVKANDDVILIEKDYDNDQKELSVYQLKRKLPAAIIFNEDKEINRIVGEKSKRQLLKLLNKYLNETSI